MLLVVLGYAIIYGAGWLAFAWHLVGINAPPDPTHSLLLAFITVWASEGRK